MQRVRCVIQQPCFDQGFAHLVHRLSHLTHGALLHQVVVILHAGHVRLRALSSELELFESVWHVRQFAPDAPSCQLALPQRASLKGIQLVDVLVRV